MKKVVMTPVLLTGKLSIVSQDFQLNNGEGFLLSISNLREVQIFAVRSYVYMRTLSSCVIWTYISKGYLFNLVVKMNWKRVSEKPFL